MSHAIVNASGADMWMVCTPSARLNNALPDEGSDFAMEGTICHALAELIFKEEDRRPKAWHIDHLRWEFGPETFDKFYCKEMQEHAEGFVEYVLSFLPEKYYLFIEHQLDTSSHIPKGFGTMDAGAVFLQSDDNGKTWYWILYTFDLKYGKGISVSAIENRQQKIYAIGMLNDFGHIFDIRKIVMHIYQPRLQNNTEFEISREALDAWGENELKPAAALAFAGEGPFVPGEKQCRFCKFVKCRALAEYNEELAKYDFADANALTDEEIIEIYEREDLFSNWFKNLASHILSTAIKGKQWPGYKVVHGRSNRVISDKEKAIKALNAAGIDKEQYQHPFDMLGLEDLENNLGTDTFNKLIGPLITKPPGKPTMAKADSTKTEYNPAVQDFQVYIDREDYII